MATLQVRISSGGRSIFKILKVRHFSSIREPSTDTAASNFSRNHGEGNDEEKRRDQDRNCNRDVPEPLPNRPLRRERYSFNAKNNSSNHGEGNAGEKRQDQDRNWKRNVPEPLPNRPLRRVRDSFNVDDNSSNNNNSSPQSRTRGPNRAHFQPKSAGDAVSDDAFLEKFKLRTESPQPDHPPAPTPTKPQKSDPPPDAQDIFKRMKETGLIPNAVAMLDGLCKDGLVQDAMKLFASMRETGTIPEVVIYTAVVDGFCKAHKPDEAKRIFAKMQANGITPNAFTYSILVQGLCKCNSLDDAIDFSLQMLEAGHSPNVTTFVGLVDGLCREKGVEEARTVVATLREKGFYIQDKSIREFLDKNAPFPPSVWEAIFGKKPLQKPF